MSAKGGGVKVKKVMADIDMDALNEVMGQMSGAVDPDPMVIFNKFNDILTGYTAIAVALRKMANTFRSVGAGDGPEPNEMEEVADMLDKATKDRILDFTRKDDQFADYNTELTSDVIRIITKCYGSLEQYHIYLDVEDVPDMGFILRHPTDDFIIISSITSWNIKRMFKTIKGGENFKKFCMKFLSVLFKHSKKIYTTATSPNVDPDKLASTLMEALTANEKLFPRHKLAFAALRKNVDLLKNNMNSYYKEFLGSKDSSVFFHNFIIDVSESNSNLNAQTKMQLKDLLSQLRKSLQKTQIEDPKMKEMINQISKSLPFLDNNSKSEKNKSEDDVQSEVTQSEDLQSEDLQSENQP